MIYDNDTMSILMGVMPLIFLPFTQDYYDTNKWMLLVLVTLSASVFWLISEPRRGSIRMSLSALTISLGAITLASIISLLVISENKVEAMLMPYGAITFGALTLLSLFAPIWFDAKKLRWSLFIGVALLALITIYQAAGMGKLMFPALTYLTNPIWTPTGSLLSSLSIFAITLPFMFSHLRKLKSEVFIIMILVVVVGLGVSLWLVVPRLPDARLPLSYGVTIMREIFKNPLNALFGFGAENFLTAFSAGRPASINLTPLWNIRFSANASMLLHLVTTYGIVGLVACLFFAKNLLRWPFWIALIWFIFISPNFSVLLCIVGLLFLAQEHHMKVFTIHIPYGSEWVAKICVTIGLLSTLAGFYIVGRVYLSEFIFHRSIVASKQNKGTDAYNLQIRAIGLSPAISRFHTTYSQTNLALSTALAREMNTNQDLTEDARNHDRDLVGQLTQQAIREAKIAVNLNPKSILAWENLARTYQQLMGVAQGADDWATTTFVKAIALDPANPALALDLAGVYIRKKNYTEAIGELLRATTLKPDYTNAWYNLSYAYRLSGDIPSAQKTLERVQSMVGKNSSEYRQIMEDMENLVSPPLELLAQ